MRIVYALHLLKALLELHHFRFAVHYTCWRRRTYARTFTFALHLRFVKSAVCVCHVAEYSQRGP